MEMIVSVERVGSGVVAERVAYDTEPRDWTDSDIAEILRRMAGCIRERGEWRMPGRVVRAGTMTFFEVEAVDGRASVRGGLWGVPDATVSAWRARSALAV